MSATALHLADYLLTICTCGDMDHLKLEKMCAYTQAHALALGRPLFDEDMLAYEKGPVIPSVYECYKGADYLPREWKSRAWLRKPYDPVQNLAIERCADHYGQFSPNVLATMSHMEFPCPGRWGDKKSITAAALIDRFKGHPYTKTLYGEDRDYPTADEAPVSKETYEEVMRVLGL